MNYYTMKDLQQNEAVFNFSLFVIFIIFVFFLGMHVGESKDIPIDIATKAHELCVNVKSEVSSFNSKVVTCKNNDVLSLNN